jgi:thiol-disulfide isomerase/thioredoxin
MWRKIVGASRFVIASFAIALVLTVGWGLVNRSSTTSSNSTSAQSTRQLGAFDLPDLRDPAVRYSNASLFGRPAVITVFDSTCVSCRTELPMIQEVASEASILVLGVDHLDRPRDALKFVDDIGISFPVAHELTGDLSVSWQLAGLPTTLFVDSGGREVGRVTGSIARDDLLYRIKRLS